MGSQGVSSAKSLAKKFRATLGKLRRRIIINRRLGAEARQIKKLGQLGRPSSYLDDNMGTDARLRQKVWWWLSDSNPTSTQGWVEYYQQEHPAKNVGTKNLSYREAWLQKTLKKIPKNSKVLDAGAGELQYKKFCKHLNYISQDFGQYTGEGSEGLQMGSWDNSKLDIVSDITDIPVKDSSFDAVMCIEVFEHIPKPINALREFKRILKPGGWLIITTPFSSLVHFAPYYFYNGYSRYFYEKLLPEFDFEIMEMDFNGNYFEYLAQELRRLDEVADKYAPNTSEPTYMDELTRHWLLRRLENLSKNDTGSNELLVQGVHILARKK